MTWKIRFPWMVWRTSALSQIDSGILYSQQLVQIPFASFPHQHLVLSVFLTQNYKFAYTKKMNLDTASNTHTHTYTQINWKWFMGQNIASKTLLSTLSIQSKWTLGPQQISITQVPSINHITYIYSPAYFKLLNAYLKCLI